jgi:hypothetical protein
VRHIAKAECDRVHVEGRVIEGKLLGVAFNEPDLCDSAQSRGRGKTDRADGRWQRVEVEGREQMADGRG